jgi:hypothetical protein
VVMLIVAVLIVPACLLVPHPKRGEAVQEA